MATIFVTVFSNVFLEWYSVKSLGILQTMPAQPWPSYPFANVRVDTSWCKKTSNPCTGTSFSTLSGIGHGLALNPGFLIVDQYFKKKKGTAMAIAGASSGVGILVSPMPLSHMFDTYGHQGGFMLLAALTLHGFVSGALYRPIEQHLRMTHSTRGTQIRASKRNSGNNSVICDFGVFTNVRFTGYFTIMSGLFMSVGVITSLLPALVIENGLTLDNATLTLASIGAGDIVGSFLLGLLLDIPWLRNRMGFWFSFCNMILAVAMVVYPHLYTTHGFIIISVLQAGFSIHLVSQRVTALSGIVLHEQINAALGLVLFGNATGALIGRGLGGKFLSMGFYFDHIIWSSFGQFVIHDVLWFAFIDTSTGWC